MPRLTRDVFAGRENPEETPGNETAGEGVDERFSAAIDGMGKGEKAGPLRRALNQFSINPLSCRFSYFIGCYYSHGIRLFDLFT